MIHRLVYILLLLAGFAFSCTRPAEKTRVRLDQKEITLYVGEQTLLTAHVTPSSLVGDIKWESLRPGVASVAQDGLVTAVAAGQTQVIAVVDGVREGCHVKVLKVPVPVESVSLSLKNLKLVVGKSQLLTCAINPANSDSTEVRWTVSAPDVVEVSDGNVTGLSEGEAYVIATVDGKSDKCLVSVVTDIPVEDVELDVSSTVLELGERLQLNATITPDDAVDKTVLWSSSNPLVAQVSEDGEVTSVGVGEAVITALAVSGGVSAECHVSVTVSVRSISLDKTSMELYEGDDFTLIATVLPENAVNRNVRWSSSDEKVAIVTEGLVKALSAGRVDISVTTLDGNYTAICSVNVLPATKPVEEVVLDVEPEITMKAGQQINVSANIYPEDARKADIVWESSDASGKIVTVLPGEVDSRIMIKAMGNGEATVSAVVNDEGREFRATVKITVDSGVSWNEGFASGDIEWD